MNLLFINILLVACLTSIGTDIYAPSLAAIASDLNTYVSYAQFSLSIYLVGVALSQLVYGPLSEGVGRKNPLIVGILVFIVSSFVCMFSTSIEILIIGRFFQGIGAGACASLWRAVFRDVYQGDELAKYGSWLATVITFIIPAIPVLGGYLQKWLGWWACFAFLVLYGILVLIFMFTSFKETSVHHHKDRLNKQFLLKSFGELLSSRIFTGYVFCVFLCYGAFFSWITVGPILLVKHLGLSPAQFGWVSFLIGAFSMGLGGAVNARVVMRLGSDKMLRIGWSIMLIAGLILFVSELVWGLSLYALCLSAFLFCFGGTFIWSNAFAGAFSPFGHIAGYASSLYSFMQLGGGALIGSIAAFLPSSSALPLSIIFIVSPLLAWGIYRKMIVQTGT